MSLMSNALAAAVGLSACAAALAAPGEVNNLAWCSGTKTCLQWNAVSGATEYRVYRGERLSLPCLVNPAFDSCSDGTFAATTTGTTVTEVPSDGRVFWFLVTAADGGGEGPYGLATAGPRSSQHTGACLPACVLTGVLCSASVDCCSGSCVAGICQAACCSTNGVICSQNGDCCTGNCSLGLCEAVSCGNGIVGPGEQCDDGGNVSGDGCSANCAGEIGFFCVGSPSVCQLCAAGVANCNLSETDACEVTLATDPQNCGSCGLGCSGAPNASPACIGGNCGIACNSGFADCDAGAGNGCECAGSICCSGACEPVHVNGLGQSFDSCAPQGVPGNAATYTPALATQARAAWPIGGSDSTGICGGGAAVTVAIRQTATSCAVWQFGKTAAGHVNLNTASNTCICPTTGDPVWF